jgi:Spy/CpxP family protein refolding chaperone
MKRKVTALILAGLVALATFSSAMAAPPKPSPPKCAPASTAGCSDQPKHP